MLMKKEMAKYGDINYLSTQLSNRELLDEFFKSVNNNMSIKKIMDEHYVISYDGGYNKVYDLKCDLWVIGNKKITDEITHWDFKISSEYDDYYILDKCADTDDFMDFFIDDYIRNIGIIFFNDDCDN